MRRRRLLRVARLGFLISSRLSQRSFRTATLPLQRDDDLEVRNLVFKGGGPKGIAYVEALEELKSRLPNHNLRKVMRVGGTSAGGITAALLSVGYRPTEMKQMLEQQDLLISFILEDDIPKGEQQIVKEILNSVNKSSSPKIAFLANLAYQFVRHPISSFQLAKRYKSNRGISTGEKFKVWLNEQLRNKIVENELQHDNFEERKEALLTQYAHPTFGQLSELIFKQESIQEGFTEIPPYQEFSYDPYKHLYIVGAQYANQDGKLHRRVSTSEKNLPNNDDEDAAKHISNLTIASAVRESMSVPFLFTPSVREFLDGDLLSLEAVESTPEIGLVKDIKEGIDGGVIDNYAYDIFDRNRYLTFPDVTQPPNQKFYNHETLGFYLYDQSDMSFLGWLQHTGKAVLNRGEEDEPFSEKKNYLKRSQSDFTHDKLRRHIFINNCDVKLTQFDIEPEKIEELLASGAHGVQLFWNRYDRTSLQEKQKKAHKDHEINFRALSSQYFKGSNLPAFVHSPTSQYTQFSEMRTRQYKEGVNPILILLAGIAGSGKSELVYYAAKQYLKLHFWKRWAKHGLHDEDSNLLLNKNKELDLLEVRAPFIWLFNAESRALLWQSFLAFREHAYHLMGNIVSPVGNTEQSRETSVDALQADITLANNCNLIWIFNDAIDDDAMPGNQDSLSPRLSRYIQKNTSKTEYWITTQNRTLLGIKPNQRLTISSLPLREAKEFVYNITKLRNVPDILITELDALPLNLVIASSYIKARNLNYDGFLRKLRDHRKTLGAEFDKIAEKMTYSRSQITVIKTVLDSIQDRQYGNYALEILRFCSVLSPDIEIDTVSINKFIAFHHQELEAHEIEYVRSEAIRLIQNYSLLHRLHSTEETYSIHRTTQAVINERWFINEGTLRDNLHEKLPLDEIDKSILKTVEWYESTEEYREHTQSALNYYSEVKKVPGSTGLTNETQKNDEDLSHFNIFNK